MNGFLLAIDPSLNNSGYTVLKITEQRNKQHKIDIIECTHVPNHQFSSSQYGHKLRHLERRLYQLRDTYKPFIVVKENLATRTHDEAVKLGTVHSFIEMAFEGYTIVGYAPNTIKLVVTGSGKSTKDEVADALRQRFGNICFATDDCSDSLAIACTYLIEQGVIKREC